MSTDNIQEKLSLKRTAENVFFAMRITAETCRSLVFHSFFAIAVSYFEWVFFDGVFIRKIVSSIDGNESFVQVMKFIVFSAVLFFFVNLYKSYVENVVYPLGFTKLYKGVYRKLYCKARNVELRCYEDSDFYNKYTMAIDGADTKITEVVRHFWGILIGIVALGIVFKFMFDIDHFAVLFIFLPLIGNFIFGNYMNKVELKRYEEQAPNNKVHNYVNRMMYLPDGAKEIRLTGIFEVLRRDYKAATVRNTEAAKKYAFADASLNFWRITFTFTAIFEGVLAYAIYRNLVSKTISLSQLTVMTSLMVAMAWILIYVFEDIMALMKNGIFLNNVRTFLEYEETVPENQDGIIPEKFESVEFRNVSFSYADEKTVKNLSFKINKGDIIAFVGHNGAGKTTIIKLLLRLYDPDEGEILLNGINIKEYNLKAYREMFAATFQDFSVFALSVKDNILMGRHYDNDDEIVENALKRADIYDKVMSLPNGINTIMTKEFNDDGAILSGGQHQKIAVARTFAKDSPVKIFDEPSSALDPIAEYELFKNIMREGRTHTMIFISHRLSSVKSCDKVFMLEHGTLIESGNHQELIDMQGKYCKMYTRQAMNYMALENEGEVVL